MPTLTADAVLRAAAEQIEADPARWGREWLRDPKTGCMCAMGFIADVIHPGLSFPDPRDMPTQLESRIAAEAMAALDDYLCDEYGLDWRSLQEGDPEGTSSEEPLLGWWNDRRATGPAEVAQAMRAAAERLVCPTCRGAGGWQQPDGLIVECPRGCMTGGAA